MSLQYLANAIRQALDAASRALASQNKADASARIATDAANGTAENAATALQQAGIAAQQADLAATAQVNATAQVPLAAAQVALATTQANTATTQAGNAATAATAAQAAQAQAEAARDSVNATGKVFADTASGIAGTTSGQTFAVLDATLNYWTIYKNNGDGTATAVASSYTKAYQDAWLPKLFETLDTTYGAGVALFMDAARRVVGQLPDSRVASLAATATAMFYFESLDPSLTGTVIVDSQRRVVLSFASDHATLASLAAGAASGSLFETLDATYSFCYLDSQRRILGSATSNNALAPLQAQVAAAAGDQVDMATRLSHGLTPYGDPLDPYCNRWALRDARMRLRKLQLGENVQLVLALIGDSYTQSTIRYAGPLAKSLQTAFGSCGIGWFGFGWFGGGAGPWTSGSQPSGLDLGARYDLVPAFQIIGYWTCSYNAGSTNAPSLSLSTSSTAGDYVRMTIPAGMDTCRLFYGGDGTGAVQVSWNDGATYSANIALNTVGAANVALAGVPAGGGTLRIKVVAGNVSLAGVDLYNSTAAGVRVHKLGGSGSSAAQWASVTQATWAAQMLALGAHVHQIMLATNDQGGNVSPSTFAAQLGTIFANIASAFPYTDKLVVIPAENARTTNTFPMTQYAQAAREWAAANDAAFCDLQYFFGSPANHAAAYNNANPSRPWLASDLIHPDPNTGGRVIVDAEYRLFASL